VYFRTSSPALWTHDSAAVAEYARLYGTEKAERAVQRGMVCENTDPAWVAGTYWPGKVWDELGRVVYELPVSVPEPAPPVGPWGQSTTPIVGFSDILAKLATIETKLDKLLAR
jgi:hypothetical protein